MWSKALHSDDRDFFISEHSGSLIWGDLDYITDEQFALIADYVGDVWDASHRSICSFIAITGFTQAKFASTFSIPKRSVKDLCRGISSSPGYIRMMIQSLLGLI